MNKRIVGLAKRLMYKQYKKNKAPAWELTEIVIKKGKELAEKYEVDENMVLTSLYLAHTIFHTEYKGRVQKNHERLSAKFASEYLNRWDINKKELEIILNSILAHHNKIRTKSLTAEVVKNAECYKFITLEGCKIYFNDLKKRGYDDEKAAKTVIEKMYSKKKLLTFKECKKEADKNIKKILRKYEDIHN